MSERPDAEQIQEAAGLGSLGSEEDAGELDQFWNTLERMAREIDDLQRFRRRVFWTFWILLAMIHALALIVWLH